MHWSSHTTLTKTSLPHMVMLSYLKEDEMIKTRIKTPPLDQTEGRKEGNLVKMLRHPKIQGLRKRSLQAPPNTLPIISLLASLPKQRSQVTLLKTQACNKIKSSSQGDNDEQPADKEVTKADWFKKPERPPTPDPDWSKRRQVDFRPPQTWISQAALAEEPPTSFDEFNDTSFDFSAFVMNRLKIPNLTQEILVGPAFNLLKGTCKSITELEYHLEECSKATTERLD
ncbi:hypothetical protein Tco_0694910 [Tanacetum coccineum]